MSRVIVLDDTLNLAASSSVVIYLLDISSVRIFLTLNAPLPGVTSGVTFFLQIITWPSSSMCRNFRQVCSMFFPSIQY